MIDVILRLGFVHLSALSFAQALISSAFRSEFVLLGIVSLALALVFVSLRGGGVTVKDAA